MAPVVDIVTIAARITHEVLRVRLMEQGDDSLVPWENCTHTYQDGIRAMVRNLIMNPEEAANSDLYLATIVGALVAAITPDRTIH